MTDAPAAASARAQAAPMPLAAPVTSARRPASAPVLREPVPGDPMPEEPVLRDPVLGDPVLSAIALLPCRPYALARWLPPARHPGSPGTGGGSGGRRYRCCR